MDKQKDEREAGEEEGEREDRGGRRPFGIVASEGHMRFQNREVSRWRAR